MVTVAVDDRVTSASATAVTVDVELLVTAGAVYRPLASIVPSEAVQLTALFVVPVTVAVNCCCCVGNSVLVFGLTLINTPPPPALPPLLPPLPPHEISVTANISTISNAQAVGRVSGRCFRETPASTSPAAEIHTVKGALP